ncbi:MAG TPA: quinone oxidoreductase [Sphingomicrobium sp.]|nr:quinone oxidoreductase [Sphingomicrobium sp.]
MARQVRIHQVGGPEALQVEEVEVGLPGHGEVRIQQCAAGVNYVDVYHRTGLYPLPGLPAVLGVEGAGFVEAVGPGVADLSIGERVAWAGLPVGGYAEARLLPAERLISLPALVSERVAAAAMLRGITAHMLLRHVRPVTSGDVVLVHAAAGGLGLMLTQWARRLGATVIGTVGSPEKAELAKRHGLHHAILYRQVDFVKAVLDLTDGHGADVAYDGIGGDVLTRTLDCVRRFGMVVSVGQAAGSLPAIDISELGPRRSLALARPSVFSYASDPGTYRIAASELFREIEAGLHVEIGAEYALAEAADAHRALESGGTTGSVLLNF